MAAASALIVTHANGETPTMDGIFAGLSFFLVQRLPSRTSFVEKIQSNGGRVVKLEAQADHIIADHYKPNNCPPGSISYTFIDKALQDGALPEPDEHKAGAPKGSVRPAGTGLPTKSTRTPFTAEDDKELYLWVKKHEAKGGSVKGNELYKQLEVRNPRHTYQAWRDRYIKRLMDKPPADVDVNAVENVQDEEEEDASAQNARVPAPTQRRRTQKAEAKKEEKKEEEKEEEKNIVVDGEGFTEEEVERLAEMGGDIENVEIDRVEEAWGAWAERWPEHSATAWRRLWDEVVRPRYLQRQKAAIANDDPPDQQQEANAGDGANDELQEDTRPPSRSERPQSSSSLKRKRTSVSPRKQATYGRKRQREGNEIFGEGRSDGDALPGGQLSERQLPDASNKEPQGDSAVPTSDANKAAAMQLDDDWKRMMAEVTPRPSQQSNAQQTADGEKEPDMETSEANNAAAMQLEYENERLPAQPPPKTSPKATLTNAIQPNSDINRSLETSDLNRDADQQLQDESLVQEKSPQEEEAASVYSDAQNTLHSDAVASQIGNTDPSDLVQPRGDALTEENLATQDEQHREPLVRGTDLPQDDEMQDQSDFVSYLQGLQRDAGEPARQDGAPEADKSLLSGKAQGSELRTSQHLPVAEPEDTSMYVEADTTQHHSLLDPAFDDLPMSSQQELDEIMDQTLQWPESPGTTKTKPVSQEASAQFETQIQYPFLPVSQNNEDPFSQEELADVHNPDLQGVNGRPNFTSAEELQTRFDREVLGIEVPEDGQSKEGGSVDDEASNGNIGEGGNGEINLEIPEPEGGFGFSSSQAWGSQQPIGGEDHGEHRHELQNPRLQAIAENDLDLEVPEPEGGFGFSSSPPRELQHTQMQAAQPISTQAKHLPALHEDEDETIVKAPARVTVVDITSSSFSSSSSSFSEADSDPDETHDNLPTDYPRALETQDIYNAATQFPDFDMPSPDNAGPSSPIIPNSSPTKPPTQQASQPPALTETQPLAEDDVDDYVNRMTLAYNHSESAVIEALKCTSMRAELADLVLLEGKAGKGLPADVPGIWSEREDGMLEGGDARAIRGLEEKHGWEECEARLVFLQEWREDEDEE